MSSYFVQLALIWFLFMVNKISRASDVQHAPRQLDPISGGDVLRRNIGDMGQRHEVDFPASKVLRSLMEARMLDGIRGGHLLRALDNTITGRNPDYSDLINDELFNLLKDYKGGDALAALELMTDGAVMRALENIEGTDLSLALDKAVKDSRMMMAQKRTLDTLSGVAFGESKRMRPTSSLSLAKRNFDEIDNVGFNGWQKRWGGRYNTLALARRAFGGPHRMGTSSLAKKNFDEIDRTGFEGFTKREAKTSV